jgi:hypothetical protein
MTGTFGCFQRFVIIIVIAFSLDVFGNGSGAGIPMFSNPEILKIPMHDLAWIGDTIYRNECGGKEESLLTWNRGEDFPSLGIGHFIWYPEGMEGPFEESFPMFIDFVKGRGLKVPAFISSLNQVDCPWKNRKIFYRSKNSPQMKSLHAFLKNTRYEQTLFIVGRLEKAIPKIMDAASFEKKDHIRNQLVRIADSSRTLYALIDYVNFKGEGIKLSERYNNQGWGLLQVLEEMSGTEPGYSAIHDFIYAAEKVLVRRVDNSPPGRNEKRWLSGWKNRINEYRLLVTAS